MKGSVFTHKAVDILLEFDPTLILGIILLIAYISYQSAIFNMTKKYLDDQIESK